MGKVTWKPGTLVYPIPAVLVSCGTMENANVFTVVVSLCIDPWIIM